MAIAQLPLTNVTADSITQELMDRITAKFPQWTDQQDSDNMVMLLEQVGAVGELLYAYINRMARESFIHYALDPNNVVAHARGLGYSPRYQTPATVTGVISSTTAVSADTVIPAGTKFGTALSGVSYETLNDVTIPAGQSASPDVDFAQQESWYDDFVGSGQSNQVVQLNTTPVMPDTLSATVDGVLWTKADSLVGTSANSTVFTWLVDSSGSCSVVFGDGSNGKKPAQGAAIRVFYKTGGGKANTIGAGQLSTCLGNVRDGGTGILLTLTAYNALAAVPGADPETRDDIKVHALTNLKAPSVLLTLDDVQGAVAQVAGVVACKAVNWKLLSSLPKHILLVILVPTGWGAPSQQLIDNVTNLLTVTKQLFTGYEPQVIGATYRTLDFRLQVYTQTGYSQVTVNNAVAQQIRNLFDPSTAPVQNFKPDFGMGVYTSQLVAILQQVTGVRNLVMLTPSDTQLDPNEYPVVGNITFV